MAYPQGGYGGGYQQQPGYPGYGYPQPGYGGVEHPQGTTILVLGICAILLCQICGPIAWSMGNKALEEIDRDPLRYSNRSAVNTGRILGIAGTVILGLYVVLGLLYVIFFVVIFAGASTSG
jgi:hypothetical protein